MTPSELVVALVSLQRTDYCGCGRPRDEHAYWEDRVQGCSGLTCPGPNRTFDSEYRYNAASSARRHAEAQVALVQRFKQDVEQAFAVACLKNCGIDVECGACMEVAFTGVTTNAHGCSNKQQAMTVKQ